MKLSRQQPGKSCAPGPYDEWIACHKGRIISHRSHRDSGVGKSMAKFHVVQVERVVVVQDWHTRPQQTDGEGNRKQNAMNKEGRYVHEVRSHTARSVDVPSYTLSQLYHDSTAQYWIS